MISDLTFEQAQAVENAVVIQRQGDGRYRAYVKDDDIPDSCKKPPAPTAADVEEMAAYKLDNDKLLKAVVVRMMEVRLGRNPTGAELRAERDRIAAIYRAL